MIVRKGIISKRYYLLGLLLLIIVLIQLSLGLRRDLFFDWTKLRPRIKDSVLLVCTDYGFKMTKFYPEKEFSNDVKRRIWLINYATNLELEYLLKYPDGKIIVTAFQGLLLKNDSNIMKHLEYVLNDTTEYIWADIGLQPVGVYCLEHVLHLDSLLYDSPKPPEFYNPIFDCEKRFTDKEIARIDSIINKNDLKNYDRFRQYYYFN